MFSSLGELEYLHKDTAVTRELRSFSKLVFMDIYRNFCEKTHEHLPPKTKVCLLTAKPAGCNLMLGPR